MVSEQKSPVSVDGLLCAVLAFGWWGIIPPLYFHALKDVPVWEVLSHRILWSVPFLGLLLLCYGRLPELARCLRDKKVLAKLLLTTVLIAINWVVYIYGVISEQVVQTSLGYFINPLINVLLGLLVFGERLRGLQWLAVALAAVGVLSLTLAAGELPWIALSLAFSFGIYGLIRKTIAVNGLVCLSVEVLLLAPLCLGYVLYLGQTGEAHFGTGNWGIDALLVLSAVITAVPLLAFGRAARHLPLTLLGFVQYLAPTLQFLTAILILHEPLDQTRLVCFGFIWLGLLVYSGDSLREYRRQRLILAGPAVSLAAKTESALPRMTS
jgi:chloramphenicol-sensitive protein RarD